MVPNKNYFIKTKIFSKNFGKIIFSKFKKCKKFYEKLQNNEKSSKFFNE